MIAVWTISFCQSLNKKKKFDLVELGAGNGEMMKILLESFKKFPIFFKACNFKIHEKSPLLIKIQKKKLIGNKINVLKFIRILKKKKKFHSTKKNLMSKKLKKK